jgi:hypothetical protein
MGDHRLGQINRVVSSYDPRLFAIRSSDGVIHVLRQGTKPGDSDYSLDHPVRRPNPQFIFCLTDNWQLGGVPVEWGMEPVWNRLREMDTWGRYSRPEDRLQEMRAQRDRVDADHERQTSNNNRAIAMELRKDFAKASNDIVMRAGNRNVSHVYVNRKDGQ